MLGTVLSVSYKIKQKRPGLCPQSWEDRCEKHTCVHTFGSRGDRVQIEVRGTYQTQEVWVLFYVH